MLNAPIVYLQRRSAKKSSFVCIGAFLFGGKGKEKRPAARVLIGKIMDIL